MAKLFTKEDLPMMVVVALIVWSWLIFLSVVLS